MLDKYYISIVDDKHIAVYNFGNQNRELFKSESEAWSFLKDLEDDGKIEIKTIEINLSHGYRENYHIQTRDGRECSIFIEKISKFDPLVFVSKNRED
jgi:hypothetical protein